MRDRADFTLVDTLRSIPGFRVQQLGGFGQTANIKTRGLRNQDTAVLIDGIRFRDPSAITGDASPFLSDFTLTSVSKIEVLRGSGSSLYGTNAIGGVIDFQTPEPPQGWHGQFSGGRRRSWAGRVKRKYFRRNDGWQIWLQCSGFRAPFTQRGSTATMMPTIQICRVALMSVRLRKQICPAASIFPMHSCGSTRIRTRQQMCLQAISGSSTLVRVSISFPMSTTRTTLKSRDFLTANSSATQIINSHLIFNGYYSGLSTRRTNESGPAGCRLSKRIDKYL